MNLVGLDGQPLLSAQAEQQQATAGMAVWAAKNASAMFGEVALKLLLGAVRGPVVYSCSAAGAPDPAAALQLWGQFLAQLHEAYLPGTLTEVRPPPGYKGAPEPAAYLHFQPAGEAEAPDGKPENQLDKAGP